MRNPFTSQVMETTLKCQQESERRDNALTGYRSRPYRKLVSGFVGKSSLHTCFPLAGFYLVKWNNLTSVNRSGEYYWDLVWCRSNPLYLSHNIVNILQGHEVYLPYALVLLKQVHKYIKYILHFHLKWVYSL